MGRPGRRRRRNTVHGREWLPAPTTGRWEINSIGQVVHDGQRMLIAVLSTGNDTEDSGISLVESVAQAAAGAMSGDHG